MPNMIFNVTKWYASEHRISGSWGSIYWYWWFLPVEDLGFFGGESGILYFGGEGEHIRYLYKLKKMTEVNISGSSMYIRIQNVDASKLNICKHSLNSLDTFYLSYV